VRSFLWTGGGQLIGQVVSWLATILIIRLLSPGDYGLMAMATALLGFFTLIADLGFGSAAVQAQTLERSHLRQLLGMAIVANAGGCLIMLAGAPLAASFFGEPRLTPIVRVLSVNFLLLAAYVLPQSQVVRELDFRTKARIDVVATVSAAGVGLGMAAAGFGVWALVGNIVLTQLVRAVGYNVARPLRLVPSFAWSAATRLAQFGAMLTADRLLFFLYGQIDIVIGGRALGKEALGLYAVALSLSAVPMDKVLPIFTQVSFAAFSRIQGEADRVQRNVLRAVHLVSLGCFPAFLGMAAVAGDLVPVVLGDRWLPLVVPFQVLCLVLPFKALGALLPPALFGVGRPGVNVANMAFTLVAMTGAIFAGVQYGVLGLCLAWLFAFPPVFVVTTLRSLRALGIRATDFASRARFAAVASIVMAGAVLAIREALATMGASPARLAILIAGGASMYAAEVALFHRREVRDLMRVALR
jgi:O-antigen/teichoic acid export membrane protein